MSVLLTGWSGHALATPGGGGWAERVGTTPLRHPSGEVRYDVVRVEDGSVVLSATSADFVVRKTVRPGGRTEVIVERNGDVLSVVALRAVIVVTRGQRSVTVNVNGGHEEQLARVRAMLVDSTASRALRTLATVLEESGSEAPEKMGIRLTGALVGQMDGDEGAVRRLSRDLQAHDTGPLRRTRKTSVDCWARFRAGVMKASSDLECSLDPFSFVNPMRQVCSFLWVHEVERLWIRCLSGSREQVE